MRETARREVDRIRWSPPESSMGLDQSSRAVELKPLKEKRKGFRHTLAIQKAGRTDPDEMRVYRWLKAYIKHNRPHRTAHAPAMATPQAALPGVGRAARRSRASAHAAPAPRAGPARPAAKCYGTRTRRAGKDNFHDNFYYRLQLTAPDRGRCVARGLSPWRAPAGPSIYTEIAYPIF